MSLLAQDTSPQAHARQGFTGGIAALADGKLYALQNPFPLDGRVSMYAASARGYSVANSYMLTQPDAAMLIDTGFGKDEPTIRGQIESLITPGLPLSMFPLRLNEYVRASGLFDGVVDFDKATLDPGSGSLKGEFVPESTTGGPGDKLHPNRAGYLAMGAAIDLGVFGVAP